MSIAERGLAYALKTHGVFAAKLEAAQRQIEDEITNRSFRKPNVTVQLLLGRARLNPAYLEKKSRFDLTPAVKPWIREMNAKLLAGGRPAVSEPVHVTSERHEMKQLLSRYAALGYEHEHQAVELRRLRDRIRVLESQNEQYRKSLDGLDAPSCREY